MINFSECGLNKTLLNISPINFFIRGKELIPLYWTASTTTGFLRYFIIHHSFLMFSIFPLSTLKTVTYSFSTSPSIDTGTCALLFIFCNSLRINFNSFAISLITFSTFNPPFQLILDFWQLLKSLSMIDCSLGYTKFRSLYLDVSQQLLFRQNLSHSQKPCSKILHWFAHVLFFALLVQSPTRLSSP